MDDTREMTREEAIANLNMISVAFVEPVTEEQRKLIDDTFDMAIKALEQEPTDRIEYGTDGNAYKLWISNGKEYEQEPCEDAISRQAAKRALEDRFMELQKRHDDKRYETNYCLNTILELPPVNPTKTGHWIVHEKPHGIRYLECPYCNIWYLNEHLIRNSFCPNCGAKMVEPQESEDNI